MAKWCKKTFIEHINQSCENDVFSGDGKNSFLEMRTPKCHTLRSQNIC